MEKQLIAELEEEIRLLKMLEQDRFKKLNTFDNYIYLSKRKILDLMNVLRIERHNGVKRTMRSVTKVLSVGEIMSQFSDVQLAELVVCNVDVEKTIDNIMIKKGYSRAIAEGVLRNLNNAYEVKIEDIEVLK